MPGVGTVWRALAAPVALVDTLRAMLALRRAAHDLAHAPVGQLLPLRADDGDGRAVPQAVASTPARPSAEAQRWVHALKRALRYGPWRGACLVRSLALHRLLEHGGVTGSRVRVGVRSGQAFEAHAWVEVHGVVVGDRPSIASQWTPLAVAQLRAGAADRATFLTVQEELA